MNENVLSCNQITLGLNSPCEIRRHPFKTRTLYFKISIPPSMLREDTKTGSIDVKEKLQEDHSSTLFSLSETASKIETSKLLLVKKCISILTRGIKISSNKSTCVFICSLWDIMHFVLWICTDKFSFELFSFSGTLKLICVDQKLSDHPYFTRSKGPTDSFPRQSSDKGKTVMGDFNEEVSLTDVVVAQTTRADKNEFIVQLMQ